MAARFYLVPRSGVAEHRQRHLIKLDILRAGGGEFRDFLLVNAPEFGEEFLRIPIEARGRVVAVAVQVHRRRRGHRDLGDRRGESLDESEFVERDRSAPRNAAFGVRRGEIGLVPVVVVELEHRLLDHQAGGEPHEFLPVGDAAEFAVGDHPEAACLLQFHHVADRLVLYGAERLVGQFARGVQTEGLPQLRRAQQAANVIGAKGRAAVGGDNPAL